ncbi:MAG: hypothetical protein ACKVS8_07380 [Phycisphaerales bacterium]
MNALPATARVRILALLAPLAVLPGCVLDDIHDELATTNQAIGRVEDRLGVTDANIQAVQEKMIAVDGANQRLDDTIARLQMLQSIHTTLESIDASLRKLDDHLASVRKTINTIDSSIPFMKLSGDSDADKAELKEGGAPATPATEPGGVPGQPAPAPASAPTPAPTRPPDDKPAPK